MEHKKFTVDEAMIIFAFRYALGRNGLPPEICANYMLALWDQFPESLKKQIIREIEVLVERGEAGNAAAVESWARILRL